MQAAAHGANYGPSKKVATEFLAKTPKSSRKLFASSPRPKNLRSRNRIKENY